MAGDALLLIPVFNSSQKIISIQTIKPDGGKRFAKGCGVSGGRFLINGKGRTFICEGYATGASIHEAIGCTAVICFNSGNLKKVAADYPGAIVAADNDIFTDGNPGLTAAKKTGLQIVWPVFPTNEGEPKDFNDLHHLLGLKAVKEQIDRQLTIDRWIIEECFKGQEGDDWLFRKFHQDNFIYDFSAGDWFRWTGHHWKLDDSDQVISALNDAGLRYEIALHKLKNQEKDADNKIKGFDEKVEALKKAIGRLRRVKYKREVLETARLNMGITGDKWDVNPLLLGVANGVIDLETGKLKTGKQSDYIRTASPIAFTGKDTPCPEWNKFINEIFNCDAELINFVQRLLGYGMTGLNRDHIFTIFHGAGRNGKGTLLEIVKHVMGKLAHKARADVLLDSNMTRTSGSHDADVVAFQGKRLIFCSETQKGKAFDISKIKELTGGDTLNARAPYAKRAVEFETTHTLILMTNNKPRADAEDFAFWERVALIPFERSFTGDDANRELIDKLKAESGGILAWLVQGAVEYISRGLWPYPETVRAATNDYKESNNPVLEFLQEECEEADNESVPRAVLWKAFKQSSYSTGVKQKEFFKVMAEKYRLTVLDGVYRYDGIKFV